MTLITAEFLRTQHPLPDHAGGGSKEARGRVLVVGGCASVAGAPLLSAVAALRVGAGKLQVATIRGVAAQMGLLLPEAMVLGCDETRDGDIDPAAAATLVKVANKVGGLAIGPGMISPEATHALVAAMLEGMDGVPMVLDAGALCGLADKPELLHRHAGRIVITPHTGEMANMLDLPRDEIEADKLAHAREVAKRLQCVVVMKGSGTEVVAPSGEAWIYECGTIGLATSGSGDVLTGIVCGLLARGLAPMQAAAWGVFLHGEAGARLVKRDGGIGFLARELAGEIPAIMGKLCSSVDV